MDDESEQRILDKAKYIEEALTVLSRKQALSETKYLESREQRAIVEREFETAIEACIDIAGILIKNSDETMAKTNAKRFVVLANLGILSDETYKQMKKAAAFRNVLSHQYGHDIDGRQVYRSLQNDLPIFSAFLYEIRAYLSND